jgi:PAS domain S-box-containing protein
MGLGSAGFCFAIAAGVACLWMLQPAPLADRLPVIFLMQFNTALGLAIMALALTAMLTGRPRTASVLSTLIILIGIAFISEPFLFSGHPLDALLIQPFRQTSTYPGHVALGTDLSFIFVGMCILATTTAGRPTRLRVILAAVVFMTASATLLGYALHLATGSDWLRYNHMSPHTALCFATVTLPLIFLGVEELNYDRSTIAATLGAASYLLLLLLSLLGLQDAFEGGILGDDERLEPQAILVGLMIFSGVIYAGLIIYAFRNAQRYRRIAGELSESQQRLAAIIDTAADGIITIDTSGTILSANRAAQAIFDYRGDELLGRNVRTLLPTFDMSNADERAQDSDGRPRRALCDIEDEAEGVRRNGYPFPVELALARMTVGTTVVYSAIIRDISQRRQQERDLLDANAELEQFSYRTSHDLRAPVASSLGLTRILHDMISLEAPSTDISPVIERMESGLLRLDRLIETIIELKRSRLLDEPTVTIPVASAVHEAIERVRPIDSSGRIAFVVDIPEMIAIETKRTRFQMILDNLLSNAIKYADPDVATPQVSVDGVFSGGGFLLSVSDNGRGVDARDRTSLFQMFKRLHPGHAFGSGLGLYVVRKSAENMGGTVAFQALDKGSRFIVRLPQRARP